MEVSTTFVFCIPKLAPTSRRCPLGGFRLAGTDWNRSLVRWRVNGKLTRAIDACDRIIGYWGNIWDAVHAMRVDHQDKQYIVCFRVYVSTGAYDECQEIDSYIAEGQGYAGVREIPKGQPVRRSKGSCACWCSGCPIPGFGNQPDPGIPLRKATIWMNSGSFQVSFANRTKEKIPLIRSLTGPFLWLPLKVHTAHREEYLVKCLFPLNHPRLVFLSFPFPFSYRE